MGDVEVPGCEHFVAEVDLPFRGELKITLVVGMAHSAGVSTYTDEGNGNGIIIIEQFLAVKNVGLLPLEQFLAVKNV